VTGFFDFRLTEFCCDHSAKCKRHGKLVFHQWMISGDGHPAPMTRFRRRKNFRLGSRRQTPVAQAFQPAGSGDFPVPGSKWNWNVPPPADKHVGATPDEKPALKPRFEAVQETGGIGMDSPTAKQTAANLRLVGRSCRSAGARHGSDRRCGIAISPARPGGQKSPVGVFLAQMAYF